MTPADAARLFDDPNFWRRPDAYVGHIAWRYFVAHYAEQHHDDLVGFDDAAVESQARDFVEKNEGVGAGDAVDDALAMLFVTGNWALSGRLFKVMYGPGGFGHKARAALKAVDVAKEFQARQVVNRSDVSINEPLRALIKQLAQSGIITTTLPNALRAQIGGGVITRVSGTGKLLKAWFLAGDGRERPAPYNKLVAMLRRALEEIRRYR